MKVPISNGERNYLLWVNGGMPGYARKLPQRLVELNLIELVEGEPVLTSSGLDLAKSITKNGDESANAS